MKAQLRVRSNLTLEELEAGDQKALLCPGQRPRGLRRAGLRQVQRRGHRLPHADGEGQRFLRGGLRPLPGGPVDGGHKQGDTLFPRRHVEAEGGVKEWLPDNGWQKLDPEAERMV